MTDRQTLGNSTEEQARLRATALWAVAYAEEVLPLFEARHPNDLRPREAIEAGRAFAQGKRRDQKLRVLALASFKIVKDLDEPSKHVAKAASLVAALAYTHTDLQKGLQGSRQARHLLGPIVHSALALGAAENEAVGDDLFLRAIGNAPLEVKEILKHMEPQPDKSSRIDSLYLRLDLALRA